MPKGSSVATTLAIALVSIGVHAQGPLTPTVPPNAGGGAGLPTPKPTATSTPPPTAPTGVGTGTGTGPAPIMTTPPPPTTAPGVVPINAAGTANEPPAKTTEVKQTVLTLKDCLALAEQRAPQIKMASDRL